MGTRTYVALLRGINVGGRNKVPMADLRLAFANEGYGNVRTYIQSGNVLFASDAPRDALEDDLEAMLERRLRLPLTVVVRSHQQWCNVVDRAPEGFGGQPDHYRSDVMFLKAPLTSTQALRALELRDGVDRAWPGTGVVYFARLSERLAQSRMSRITARAEYARMTIRSWSTTTRLRALLDDGV